MQLWDIIPAPDATLFSRLVPDDLPDSLARFLPDREIQGVKSRVARRTRTNVTARYRAYNAETPIGERPEAVALTEVTLPPLSQKLLVTEWETLWLEMAAGSAGGFAGMIDQMYDDVQQSTVAIRNRVELARADLLVDGKFTLAAENGLTLEADYGMQSSHKPTTSVAWSDATNALPLTDELAWTATLKTDAGRPPIAALASSTVIGYLGKSAEYRNAFWGGNASAQPNLNRAQVNQVRSDNGLAPLVEYDHQLSVGGATTRLIPVDRLILICANIGETQWGITAESLELVGSNAVDFTRRDAPGLFAAVYREPDPVTGWTKVGGVVMPVAADVDGWLSADVIP
jgi:hypothetical protein